MKRTRNTQQVARQFAETAFSQNIEADAFGQQLIGAVAIWGSVLETDGVTPPIVKIEAISFCLAAATRWAELSLAAAAPGGAA